MKNIVVSIKIGLLTGCMALSSSCSDFWINNLRLRLLGLLWKVNRGVEAILVRAYADLDGIDRFGGALGADWVFGSCASDEAYKGSEPGDNMAMNAVEQYATMPDNECVTEGGVLVMTEFLALIRYYSFFMVRKVVVIR